MGILLFIFAVQLFDIYLTIKRWTWEEVLYAHADLSINYLDQLCVEQFASRVGRGRVRGRHNVQHFYPTITSGND